MKFKILKIEVVIQFVLIVSTLLFFLYDILFIEQKIELIYLGIIFLVGVFNLIGLVIRLFLVRTKMNFIYLFGVLSFFIVSFALYYFLYYDFENDIEVIIIYMSIFGFIFNTYYLYYGYQLVKKWQPKTVGNKS